MAQAYDVSCDAACKHVTLPELLHQTMHFTDDHRGLSSMLCNQLYKRWLVFCNANAVAERPVRTLPQPLVQHFIDDNIEWAKVKIAERIHRVMWGRPGEVQPDDDEYDATAEWRVI